MSMIRNSTPMEMSETIQTHSLHSVITLATYFTLMSGNALDLENLLLVFLNLFKYFPIPS